MRSHLHRSYLATTLAISILLTGCQTGHYAGPRSDHFDGKLFFNPEHPRRKTTNEIIKEIYSQIVSGICAPKTVDPPVTKVSNPNKVKITFVNHATVLIQTTNLNILTDPIWSEHPSPFPLSPVRVRPPGIKFDDLPNIHVILISHNHYDHLDLPTLKKLNNKFHPLILVPLGNKVFLENQGISNVVELDWWQKIKVRHSTITFLPTQHWTARFLHDGYQTLWGSYGIEIDHKKIYFTGDSAYTSDFKKIRKRWGQPDIAFIPIGCYEPYNIVHYSHMTPGQAIKCHKDLESKQSIAIHYGTFALGCAALYKPVTLLDKELAAAHISRQTFMVMKEGVGQEF